MCTVMHTTGTGILPALYRDLRDSAALAGSVFAPSVSGDFVRSHALLSRVASPLRYGCLRDSRGGIAPTAPSRCFAVRTLPQWFRGLSPPCGRYSYVCSAYQQMRVGWVPYWRPPHRSSNEYRNRVSGLILPPNPVMNRVNVFTRRGIAKHEKRRGGRAGDGHTTARTAGSLFRRLATRDGFAVDPVEGE